MEFLDLTRLPSFNLIGFKERTSNLNEMNADTAKIKKTFIKFLQTLSFKRLFSVYTEYESDHNSNYTYFCGKEFLKNEIIENGLETIKTEEQIYLIIKTDFGDFPNVILEAWEKIWEIPFNSLGLKRSYKTDFEIYENTTNDFSKGCASIYIGVEIINEQIAFRMQELRKIIKYL